MTHIQPITGSMVRNDFNLKHFNPCIPEHDAIWQAANDVASRVEFHLEVGDNEGAEKLTREYYALVKKAKSL